MLYGDVDKQVFGNVNIKVTESVKDIIGKLWTVNTGDNIYISTEAGNIDLITLGRFEICKDNVSPIKMSAIGYSNIGTRGNINIRSTFGNIRY